MSDFKLKTADGNPVRILLTNDDGIHAPGLAALENIARRLSDDVWIVAPETEHSGASRSLTLSHPLRLREIDARRFAVQGTPADCVLMGVRKILDAPPDLLLSGVNRGQNIADDVTYSGTIAGAMEGTALGIPSMALSQAYGISSRATIRWRCAERHGAKMIAKLWDIELGEGTLININFPDCEPDDVAGVEVTRQGKRDQNLVIIDERVDARERPYYWLGFRREKSNPAPGTDLRAIYESRISVTPLHLNLTQNDALDLLKNALS
jgi:5'-nucleotidase